MMVKMRIITPSKVRRQAGILAIRRGTIDGSATKKVVETACELLIRRGTCPNVSAGWPNRMAEYGGM